MTIQSSCAGKIMLMKESHKLSEKESLMNTQLTVGGWQAPKVMITVQDKSLKLAMEEVFPC